MTETVLLSRRQKAKVKTGIPKALLKDAGFEVVTCYPTEKKSLKKGMLVIRSKVKLSETAMEIEIPQEI